MTAAVQIVGAVLLLAGYVAAQLGALRDTSVPYLAVNVAGAACLAIVALLDQDWGFLLLEGTWAGISTAGVFRAVRRIHPPVGDPVPSPTNRAEPTTPQRTPPASDQPNRRAAPGRRAWPSLPPTRAARLAGDELSEPSRLIHLIRDTYAGAQGRQWLQPHIIWWILTFLHEHGTVPDWNTLTSPALARTVTSLGLPPGHTTVEPTGQVAMNFGLWWSLLADLTQLAYRPWWSRRWPRLGHRLPDAAQLDQRATQLGLRPWMSSATFEEISGIARALARIHDHDRRHPPDPDDFMIRILLPELLITELHWLHIPGGRPRTINRAHVDVVLLRRYDKAMTKWSAGHSLTALDHMYLRAGDILHHLTSHPKESGDPRLRPIQDLYTQLRLDHDCTATPTRSRSTPPAHLSTHTRGAIDGPCTANISILALSRPRVAPGCDRPAWPGHAGHESEQSHHTRVHSNHKIRPTACPSSPPWAADSDRSGQVSTRERPDGLPRTR